MGECNMNTEGCESVIIPSYLSYCIDWQWSKGGGCEGAMLPNGNGGGQFWSTHKEGGMRSAMCTSFLRLPDTHAHAHTSLASGAVWLTLGALPHIWRPLVCRRGAAPVAMVAVAL